MPSNGPGTGTRLWTPRDGGLPGQLLAWYDSDPDGFTPGAGVMASWLDKSGNGWTLSPNSNGARIGTVAMNGKYAADFDSAGNTVVRSMTRASTPTYAQPLTMFVAMSYQAATGQNRRWIDAGGAGSRPLVLAYSVNSDRWTLFAGSFADTGRASATGAVIHSVVFNGASSFFYENGTNYGGALNPGTAAMAGLFINGYVGMGAAESLNGPIPEFLMYQGAFDVRSIRHVERYLSARWGIPLTYSGFSPPLVWA